MFSPRVTHAIEPFGNLQPAGAALLPLALAGAVLLIARRTRNAAAASVNYAVWSTGVTGIAMDLLVLFLFQTLYGFVYQMAGLLMACLMTGIWLEGRWAINKSSEPNCAQVFTHTDAGVALLPLAFFGAALLLREIQGMVPDFLIFSALAVLAGLAGSLVGVQFPLAASLLSGSKRRGGAVAGSIYAADLLGGWFGGLAVSIVLFPVLGLSGMVIFLTALKLGSLSLRLAADRLQLAQESG